LFDFLNDHDTGKKLLRKMHRSGLLLCCAQGYAIDGGAKSLYDWIIGFG